ncbi:MAG: glycosyltransferase family 39 protein [Candidatus Acidiferrum sp.]
MRRDPHRSELLWVSAIIVAVSSILFWRFLPLPQQDLNFFTEPAYLLAKFGKLAAPGSQAYDLTYQRGIYCYPPGYFLILAGWLRLFGLSSNSLLAYTHIVHATALIMLWVLLRNRYHCSKIVCALVLLAMFPVMAHGRPDLTAAALSIAAWLALPEELGWGKLVLSGCLAGLALLVSPGYGIAIISTLVILLLLDTRRTFQLRLRSTAVWLGSAGVLFGAVTATVLTQQHSWMMAFVQFRINSSIRGAQLNVWPDFRILFAWIFCVVPFVLIAVLPAILSACGVWRDTPNSIRNVGIAFLGSAALWLTINKTQLLLDHHFLYPTKSVFVALFYSWPKLPSWLRIPPLLLLCAISFYYLKGDFLYLATPLRVEERTGAAGIHPQGIAAVDSLYFARFYRPGQTLNYEVVAFENSWERYRAAIPAYAQQQMLAGLPQTPVAPSMFLVSAYTPSRLKNPPDMIIPCAQPRFFEAKLHLLGRTWNLPANPYALMVCSK